MDTVTLKMDFPRDVLLAADISEANAPSDIKKYLALYMFFGTDTIIRESVRAIRFE